MFRLSLICVLLVASTAFAAPVNNNMIGKVQGNQKNSLPMALKENNNLVIARSYHPVYYVPPGSTDPRGTTSLSSIAREMASDFRG